MGIVITSSTEVSTAVSSEQHSQVRKRWPFIGAESPAVLHCCVRPVGAVIGLCQSLSPLDQRQYLNTSK